MYYDFFKIRKITKIGSILVTLINKKIIKLIKKYYSPENKSFLENYLKISIEIGEEKSKYALPDRPELILE